MPAPSRTAAALLLALATAGGAAAAEPSEADRAAMLAPLGLTADAEGKVVNECGEAVTPGFLPVELGGDVGTATLLVLEGGPNTAACYGDGPDLHLYRHAGDGFEEIYAARGRVLVVLPETTGGVHDIADGGPGFSFPLWQWDGKAYAWAEREVSADAPGASYFP